MGDVVLLTRQDVPEAAEVLADAFANYPVMRFVLDGESRDYEERLRVFCHFAVASRVHRGEFILGMSDDDALVGVATVSRPSVSESPPGLKALREETWDVIGAAARVRYEQYNASIAHFIPPQPHLHLNMLGVRHSAHGKGHARKLLDSVHALSRNDGASCGVSLTTEVEANVALYRHFGYALRGRVQVAPALVAWGFFRDDARKSPEM